MRSHFTTFLLLSVLSTSILFVSSCRDDDDPNPNQAPQVIVESPTKNASFNSGESIPLNLNINQDADIVNYRILIRDRSTGEFVWLLSEFSQCEG